MTVLVRWLLTTIPQISYVLLGFITPLGLMELLRRASLSATVGASLFLGAIVLTMHPVAQAWRGEIYEERAMLKAWLAEAIGLAGCALLLILT